MKIEFHPVTKKYKFHFLLAALIALILTPLLKAVTGIPVAFLVLSNYALIVVAGCISAERKIPQLLTIILGSLMLISVLAEFFAPTEATFSYMRMGTSFLLFALLAFILIRSIMDAEEIHLKVILGAIAGYILLGLIGGVTFEIMENLHAGSISVHGPPNAYNFYYYSFISLLTIGYGDIIPLTGAAKAFSVLISLIGQFYMTVGIALFVGKYLNHTNSKN